MAKKSAIAKNKHRIAKVAAQKEKRAELRNIIRDRDGDPEERFDAVLRLAKLPRNGAKIRVRNRCGITGRPRAYYRKFGISRIALRDMASAGLVPGVLKSSW